LVGVEVTVPVLVGVRVTVPVEVAVRVEVAVPVFVAVPVEVLVEVPVAVLVAVPVLVAVWVGVGLLQLPFSPPPQEPLGTNTAPKLLRSMHVAAFVSRHWSMIASADVVAACATSTPSWQQPVVVQLLPEQYAWLTTFKLHVLPTTSLRMQLLTQARRPIPVCVQPATLHVVLLPTFSQEQQTRGWHSHDPMTSTQSCGLPGESPQAVSPPVPPHPGAV
jgi:hypothetical protein